MPHETEAALSRRGFLIATGSTLAATALRPAAGDAQTPAPPPVPGKEKLIVRSSRPLNLEARVTDLTTYHTPEIAFFVRNNYDAAPVDPAQWSMRIEGEVDNPVVLRLDDLRKLPALTQDVTLECAGNGRAFHQPRASGIQWEHGAVGTQRFTGVRLADVLALAKLRPAARHVAFDGVDKPPTPQAPDFIRSVPLWKALAPHTMLAFEMAGRPIPHLHGGPVRAIVPGFVGSASIKWLERVMALTEEFNGFYMKSNYTAPRADNDKEIYSLQSLEVKSVIVSPAEGARLAAGKVTAWGWAWAGEGELTGVDVSTDGGKTWTAATLVGPSDRYAWRQWEHAWDA
ncbi:MAG: hypothetical protein AUH96_08515, partial [Nitrospirae bacterium 13_2_20CM_2_61_4]